MHGGLKPQCHSIDFVCAIVIISVTSAYGVLITSGTLGCCSVDVVSLGLPSGVPLFLEIPLIREPESEPTSGTIPRLSAGSLQIEVMVERLDH